jgi:hypothetical protein
MMHTLWVPTLHKGHHQHGTEHLVFCGDYSAADFHIIATARAACPTGSANGTAVRTGIKCKAARKALPSADMAVCVSVHSRR